jgi:hypothetical protein
VEEKKEEEEAEANLELKDEDIVTDNIDRDEIGDDEPITTGEL